MKPPLSMLWIVMAGHEGWLFLWEEDALTLPEFQVTLILDLYLIINMVNIREYLDRVALVINGSSWLCTNDDFLFMTSPFLPLSIILCLYYLESGLAPVPSLQKVQPDTRPAWY